MSPLHIFWYPLPGAYAPGFILPDLRGSSKGELALRLVFARPAPAVEDHPRALERQRPGGFQKVRQGFRRPQHGLQDVQRVDASHAITNFEFETALPNPRGGHPKPMP